MRDKNSFPNISRHFKEHTMISKSPIDKLVLQYLLGGVIVLVLANALNHMVGMPFWTITSFIHLGSDTNIPAWYSSLLLAVAAVVSLECYRDAGTRNLSGYWTFLVMAGLLLFMSCDEVAGFHEILGGKIATYYGIAGKSAGWVWLGGPIIIILFLCFFLFLKKPLSLVPGTTFYLGLGFGLIILGGVVLESTINWLNHDELQWLWDLEVLVEESFEMMGTLSIIYSFIRWRDEPHKLCAVEASEMPSKVGNGLREEGGLSS